MYKVFMDNKVMEFSSKVNSVVPVDYQLVVDLFSVENEKKYPLAELPALAVRSILVLSPNPEESLKKTFVNFEWIEAAGGLVQKDCSFLVIERFGYWDLPKGKIEKDEIPEIAAVREIEEECGIQKPTIDSFLCTTFHTYVFQGRNVLKKNWWYLLNYTGTDILTPQLEEDITSVQWIKKENIEKVKQNTYPSILEVLEHAGI